MSDFKAFLNDEGKKLWGDVFPDGMIPIKNPFPGPAQLGSLGRAAVYIVDWDGLTPVQRGQIINRIAEKFNASAQDVEVQILSYGLPIRASWISGTSI